MSKVSVLGLAPCRSRLPLNIAKIAGLPNGQHSPWSTSPMVNIAHGQNDFQIFETEWVAGFKDYDDNNEANPNSEL